jgi:hypothetical protein
LVLTLPNFFTNPLAHPHWFPFILDWSHPAAAPYLGTITVRVTASPEDQVPSATPLFPSALWLEREAWDLFGIFFPIIGICVAFLRTTASKGSPCVRIFLLRVT